MSRKNPCSICDKGGIACDDCLNSPQNSTPVRLYTPKGAIRAMLTGKVLKGRWRLEHFFGTNELGEIGFFRKKDNGELLHVLDFSGLWEEL
jgi:hypothetical protein